MTKRSWPALVAIGGLVVGPSLLAPPVDAAPPTLPTPHAVALQVHCGAGQSVSGALALAGHFAAPVVITIWGVCAEHVVVDRDDVTLQGRAPGDGLTSPPALGTDLVKVDGGRRITLSQLTLSPRTSGSQGDYGIEVFRGGQVSLAGVTVEVGLFPGLLVWEGGLADVTDSAFHHGDNAQVEVVGGTVRLERVTLEDGGGGVVVNSGQLFADTVTIRDQTATAAQGSGLGLALGLGASGYVTGAEVTGNLFQGVVANSATLTLDGHVAGNGFEGIEASGGAKVSIGGTIENNGREGIRLSGGSSLSLATTNIRNNVGSGISLADTSVVIPYPASTILGNGGWGISCSPAPAVAQVAAPGLPAANLTGNTSGPTDCPTLGLAGRLP